MAKIERLEIVYLPRTSLKPDLANVRVHGKRSVDAIAQSIEQNGFHAPIVVRADDLTVVCGNGRLCAAKKLGIENVPCVLVDESRADSLRRALSDNRVQDLSEFDTVALLEHLDEILAMNEPLPAGFDEDDVEKLRREGLDADEDDPDCDFEDGGDGSNGAESVVCPHCGAVFQVERKARRGRKGRR